MYEFARYVVLGNTAAIVKRGEGEKFRCTIPFSKCFYIVLLVIYIQRIWRTIFRLKFAYIRNVTFCRVSRASMAKL